MIGQQIKLQRVKRGLSIGETCAAINALGTKDERGKPLALTAPALSRIESGDRLPGLRTMLALADVLGCRFVISKGGIEIVSLD